MGLCVNLKVKRFQGIPSPDYVKTSPKVEDVSMK